jgi:hypothetical protein
VLDGPQPLASARESVARRRVDPTASASSTSGAGLDHHRTTPATGHHPADRADHRRPRGRDHHTAATFAFTADEPGSTSSCALDDTPPEPCTSPTTYTDLPVGEHTFSVVATDQAGNTDPSPAVRSWTVEEPLPPPDTTPPETTITSGPDAETTDTTATFAFDADEPGSTFSCSLDGAAFTTCTSPHTHTDLHTFSVAATDPAGNTDPTPALRAWTITQAPPPPPPADCGPAVTLTATADAWLDQNSSTTNKGSDSIIKVRSKQPRDNMRSLVRSRCRTHRTAAWSSRPPCGSTPPRTRPGAPSRPTA